MAALIRFAVRSTNSSIAAPLANPPAIQITDSCESSDAVAACGFVALESSTQLIASAVCTVSMRWRPGLKALIALRISSCETPTVLASAAAAKVLETLCGIVGFTSANSANIDASCGS